MNAVTEKLGQTSLEKTDDPAGAAENDQSAAAAAPAENQAEEQGGW